MAHLIRLKAAWNRTVANKIERINLPDAPIVTDGASVVYTRSFNAPSGITATTKIDLVVQSWLGEITLELDGRCLLQAMPWKDQAAKIDLTGLLNGFHEIRIQLHGKQVALTGICELEIHDGD